MYLKVTLIVILTYVYLISGYQIQRHEDTLQVEPGDSITLHCKSNDDTHNFMFWHLTTGEVIGPRNVFNNNKFNYEVLTGNLTIKAITENDAGTYSCISDGIDKRDISVHSINLLIKNAWNGISSEKTVHNVQNNNKGGNLWKISAILGSIFIFLVLILVGLHFYHADTEKPKYFDIVEQNDDDDEDSTEELFTREPSTSGMKTVPNRDESSDNFEKVYTTINMNST